MIRSILQWDLRQPRPAHHRAAVSRGRDATTKVHPSPPRSHRVVLRAALFERAHPLGVRTVEVRAAREVALAPAVAPREPARGERGQRRARRAAVVVVAQAGRAERPNATRARAARAAHRDAAALAADVVVGAAAGRRRRPEPYVAACAGALDRAGAPLGDGTFFYRLASIIMTSSTGQARKNSACH